MVSLGVVLVAAGLSFGAWTVKKVVKAEEHFGHLLGHKVVCVASLHHKCPPAKN